MVLFCLGFLGEMPSEQKRTFIIKNHLFQNNVKKFHSVIFLIRNPYDAIVADFNRCFSEKNHVGYASEEAFTKSKSLHL